MERAEIALRLSKMSAAKKPSNPFTQANYEVSQSEDSLVIDYHWIVDSVFCQKIMPLEIYTVD